MGQAEGPCPTKDIPWSGITHHPTRRKLLAYIFIVNCIS
jgi:hypothetical protein